MSANDDDSLGADLIQVFVEAIVEEKITGLREEVSKQKREIKKLKKIIKKLSESTVESLDSLHIVKMGEDGSITLPDVIVRKLDWKEGDELDTTIEIGKIVLSKVPPF